MIYFIVGANLNPYMFNVEKPKFLSVFLYLYPFCYEQTRALAVYIYSFGFVCPFCIYFSYPLGCKSCPKPTTGKRKSIANAMLSDRRKSCSTARKLIIVFECRARACYSRNEIQMYKIPRKTSNFPWDYLLFANLNSTVPSYADEFKLTKYNFLFRNLPACRWVYRHAERTEIRYISVLYFYFI